MWRMRKVQHTTGACTDYRSYPRYNCKEDEVVAPPRRLVHAILLVLAKVVGYLDLDVLRPVHGGHRTLNARAAAVRQRHRRGDAPVLDAMGAHFDPDGRHRLVAVWAEPEATFQRAWLWGGGVGGGGGGGALRH